MNEKKYNLSCLAGVIDQNMIYVYDNPLSIIMKYNLNDFSYEILEQFKEQSSTNSVIDILKCNEYLYLLMFRRPCIIRYNLIDRSIEKYLLSDLLLAPNELMWKSFLYNSQIWIFSVCAGREIISFNCHTGEFRRCCSVKKLFEKEKKVIGSDKYLSNMFQINNIIWGAVCGTTYIFYINVIDMNISIFSLDCEGINSFDYDGDFFWITAFNSDQIIKWHPEYGIFDFYCVNDINFGDYSGCYVCGGKDKVLVVPNSDKDFCIIDKKTKQYSFFPLAGCYPSTDFNGAKGLFGTYLRSYNTIILLPYIIDKIVTINLEDNIIKFESGTLLKIDYEMAYIINKLNTDRVEEDLVYNLDDYIKYINQNDCNVNNENCTKEIGTKILEKL